MQSGLCLSNRFAEVEALHRTTTLELDAARALSKNQAEALVEMAEVEKIATRNSQVICCALSCPPGRVILRNARGVHAMLGQKATVLRSTAVAWVDQLTTCAFV